MAGFSKNQGSARTMSAFMTILASLQASPWQSYVTYEMLYRYCRIIFIIPAEQRWSIFNLLEDGSTGRPLRNDRRATIKPGNYIVLGNGLGDSNISVDRTPITIQLTTEQAPRRVITEDRSSGSQGRGERDRLPILELLSKPNFERAFVRETPFVH
ncbi:hypothetical protein N7475_006636 [Penicillium sp. IBT 31633x]|nr:hypothetical protein N7475_006636 [Penicillium sp. IBT 31633x]